MIQTLSLRRRLLAIFCGGFCGTLSRYWLSQLVQHFLGNGWPYDIFLINLTGALLLAFITVLADASLWIGPTRRHFLGVGFLGAYTTFSSLALGDLQLIAAGQWFPALLYIVFSLLGGFFAVRVGIFLGQWALISYKTGFLARPSLKSLESPNLLAPSQEDNEYDVNT